MMDRKKRLGYDIKVTPTGAITLSETTLGTPRMTFRAKVQGKGGKTYDRTVVALGRAHDALQGVVRSGEQVVIRGFYDREPANEGGRRGREYITAVSLPKGENGNAVEEKAA